MTYMFLKSNIFIYLLLCAEFIHAIQVPNPVLWERSFTMNVTSGDNTGNLIQSTSNMATSQDFQGIHVDANSRFPPERIIFNFGECCHSSNQTAETIRQLNYNSLQVPAIVNAQKLALVKRGNCNWSEKLSVVNQLATANSINITAVYIYDNITHSEIAIDRKPVVGTGSQGPPNYPNTLPASRSILNMSDNDLDMTSPSTTTVYFLPYIYGNTLVTHVNQTYNTTNPDIRQYWLITPYLEEVSWGYTGEDNFFSSGKGYLSYIIALAAIFLIGVIFLRWWRIRRMRGDYPYGANGFTGGNGLHMQPRTNQLDPLPVDIVNALPVDKYADDLVKNVNCAICIEDFVPGKNDIRILPCGHGFCVLCIDPWLTQKSTLCPICKWDCLPIDLRRERNLHQQQQEQRQEQQRQDRQEPPNDSFAVNMPVPPDPPVPVSPQVGHPTAEPRYMTGSIIPTPILPAASSSASNRGSDDNPFDTFSSSATNSPTPVRLNEKRNQNPFEGSQISETAEQPTAPIANVPAFTAEVDLSSGPPSSEKKPHSKDQ